MGLLDTESGKQRLLGIEIPLIEAYNQGRAPEFRIRVARAQGGLALVYQLKPAHNTYELETRLPPEYPSRPPRTRVVTRLRLPCPHLFEDQTLCLWRQESYRPESRWDPAKFTCVFAVQAAWRWLACYEIWYVTGHWPLPEAA